MKQTPGARDGFQAIVLGTSAGGLFVLSDLLTVLPEDFALPLIVVQHRSRTQRDLLEEVLQNKSRLRVKQADEKEPIVAGTVYIAPPDYHLLIESDKTFSLSADDPVRYSRPSIDVLFDTAAVVFKQSLLGIILTGASNDGTAGMAKIKAHGGYTIAQDPSDAQFPYMPKAAIESGMIDLILPMTAIHRFLLNINNTRDEKHR